MNLTMAAKTQLRRGAWVLLALRAAEGHTLTPVQLQKVLFLLGKRRPKDVGHPFYHFRAYDYGPFDVAVYSDADQLAEEGLVIVDRSRGNNSRRFNLTAAGEQEANRLAADVPEGAVEYLAEVVPWAQSLRFDELVRAIYEAYPETRANSVFRG